MGERGKEKKRGMDFRSAHNSSYKSNIPYYRELTIFRFLDLCDRKG